MYKVIVESIRYLLKSEQHHRTIRNFNHKLRVFSHTFFYCNIMSNKMSVSYD